MASNKLSFIGKVENWLLTWLCVCVCVCVCNFYWFVKSESLGKTSCLLLIMGCTYSIPSPGGHPLPGSAQYSLFRFSDIGVRFSCCGLTLVN